MYDGSLDHAVVPLTDRWVLRVAGLLFMELTALIGLLLLCPNFLYEGLILCTDWSLT